MSRHDRAELAAAHARMTEALEILDGLGAPGAIGAHLDLSIAMLEAEFALERGGGASADHLLAQLAAGAREDLPDQALSAWDVKPA